MRERQRGDEKKGYEIEDSFMRALGKARRVLRWESNFYFLPFMVLKRSSLKPLSTLISTVIALQI